MGCTRCMDICPNGAIEYRLIGTEIGVLGTPKQMVYPRYTLKPQPRHTRNKFRGIRGMEVACRDGRVFAANGANFAYRFACLRSADDGLDLEKRSFPQTPC